MKTNDKATIKIPRNLYNNLKILIEDSGFDSVTDFIVYILRDIASTPKLSSGDDRVWDRREVEQVKEKLRQLGYL
ncbi:MAG: CopG family transcriptional regulator [PVC group bacterium]